MIGTPGLTPSPAAIDLGLTGLGNDLKAAADEERKKKLKQPMTGLPSAYGTDQLSAASMLFGGVGG